MSPPGTRPSVHASSASAPGAEEAHAYLTMTPPQLPPRWLYDSLGSALFEAICLLPWYRITRAEMQLLTEHADEIARLTEPASLVELGCGNGQKLAALLRNAPGPQPDVYLIDVSADALEQTRKALQAICVLRVTTIQAAYEEGLTRVPGGSNKRSRLTLFLGSNIGNFDPAQASAFIQLIRGSQAPGDWLLLGVDLVKPERDLMMAYDDPLGLTAAFNRNLLLRLNSEVGANFDLDGFSHRAVWNAAESRVEMHLVSLRRQEVVLPGQEAPLRVIFESGESIWTESSYRYEESAFARRIEAGGFTHRMSWVHPGASFLLALFQAR